MAGMPVRRARRNPRKVASLAPPRGEVWRATATLVGSHGALVYGPDRGTDKRLALADALLLSDPVAAFNIWSERFTKSKVIAYTKAQSRALGSRGAVLWPNASSNGWYWPHDRHPGMRQYHRTVRGWDKVRRK